MSSVVEDETAAIGTGSNILGGTQAQPAQDSVQQATNVGKPPLARKPMKLRSKVWDHFERIKGEDDTVVSAKCIHCYKVLCGNSRKNGTSSLISHMNSCVLNPSNHESSQKLLNLQPNNDEGNMGTLTAWRFDQLEIREALAKMIVRDELPFKCVEGEGFREFLSKACPRFLIPSRWSVSRDCFQLYIDERSKMKSFMKIHCERICITTDTWTSLQKINYMCVTGHFIDNEWNLHKKILNFVPVSSHKGDYLGKALENCLLDWGLRRVFNVTVDNASSNDVAISFLSKKMINWGNAVANCKHIHMRCIAHVFNLIVSDGLKDINISVKRVRDGIRYIRNSPARWRKFRECADWEGIECKSSLCLDVCTRWNSTYLMLKTAEKFERAFVRYEEEDPNFKADLGDNGVPTSVDWSCVRRYADLLKHFYESTLRISGSLYITSSSFFSEISDLCAILNEWNGSGDLEIKKMGESMKKKFDKYWGDVEKMNKLIFWVVVFDPRDKFENMEYTLCGMYGPNKGVEVFRSVKDGLIDLFDEYKNMYQPEVVANDSTCGNNLSSSSMVECGTLGKRPASIYKSQYKKQKLASGLSGSKKTELEVYLSEAVIDDENMDLLKWWKLNSERLPVLARMARDILAVPISTVASDSAFSAGGRVLDAFRSSLTPKIVEALICGQDWFRASRHPICVEEE